jgi:soluble lytic murein transglycosylase-like protein
MHRLPPRRPARALTITLPPAGDRAARTRAAGWLAFAALALLMATLAAPAQARTVYRCVRDGTVSLATAPEPGSKCTAQQVDDNAARLPNLWGINGKQSGVLYERMQDGKAVYSTRNLPGSTPLMKFAVTPPPGAVAHPGLGHVAAPRTNVHADLFRAAARASHIDDAWLRAIAHAESDLQAEAQSRKGAQGIMQLLPRTAAEYGVKDAFVPSQAIPAGARVLHDLLRRYKGDRTLATAAYNGGIGTVAKYGGVPPYAETLAYVAKVDALYERYKVALSGGGGSASHGSRRR